MSTGMTQALSVQTWPSVSSQNPRQAQSCPPESEESLQVRVKVLLGKALPVFVLATQPGCVYKREENRAQAMPECWRPFCLKSNDFPSSSSRLDVEVLEPVNSIWAESWSPPGGTGLYRDSHVGRPGPLTLGMERAVSMNGSEPRMDRGEVGSEKDA